MEELEKKLLNIGGDKVVECAYEPHLDSLLSEGRLMNPSTVEVISAGEMSQCHRNCAQIFLARDENFEDSDKVEIGSGWGLSGGMWRQHTWLVINDDKIIETTVERDKYYGITLEGEEAEKFAFKNT